MIAVMLFIGYYTAAPDGNPPPLGISLAVVALAAVSVLLISLLLNFLSLRALKRAGHIQQNRRAVAIRADVSMRVTLAGVFMVALPYSAFPWSVTRYFGFFPAGDSLAAQLLALAPYLVLFVFAWRPLYRLHRETNFGVWTPWSFMLHKARYNLFVFLAWLPFALLADWLSDFLLALPALFILAAWSFPFLLARAWGCKPVTDTPTLELVRRLEKRTGARFSRIYLWEPGGGNTQNAAAVGIFPPFRYLFLTPALVRGLKPDELEAVILHELGHVKKRHLLFYLFTSLAGINLSVLAGVLLPLSTNTERFVVTLVMVMAYFRLVFGWLSRNMERQADLFSLEHGGSAGSMVNALEKLGISAGHVRRATSWHHLGIAERVEFLRQAERRPELARWHNGRVGAIMTMGYVVSVLVLGGMALIIHEETQLELRPQKTMAAGGGSEVHWRRVMQLMPGNPTASLELAHTLASRPEGREEAKRLAETACRLACGVEEKAAADKLRRELVQSDDTN